MNKRLPIYILLVFSLSISAQKQELELANNYFERAFYADAIPLYEAVIVKRKTSSSIKNLADSFYYTSNMRSASRWYKYLIDNYGNNIGDEYFFRYSQTLKALGNYEEANKTMLKSLDEDSAEDYKKSLKYLENIRAIGNRFTIKNLAINTSKSEFGAIELNDTLVYSASRRESSFFEKLYRWNNQNYLDIYAIPLSQIENRDSVAQGISKTINSKMHEANAIFTKDGKTMYFTRNNFIKGKKTKDKNKITQLQIFKAERIGGKWTNLTSLPFNGTDYSTEHPALDADEKTLYFSSDKPGGFGSFDIYKVSIHEDGRYGEPENLGALINTDKKEQFPFISKDDKLYFSSNGLPGFGFHDVFTSTIIDGKATKPDNLGFPINSGYDDFNFNINSDTKKGYFASNRPKGKGDDDIYQLTETKLLIVEDCKQYITGKLIDKTTKIGIMDGTVLLKDGEGNILKTITTANDATFKFTIGCDTKYRIEGRKEGYEPDFKNLVIGSERKKTHDVTLALLSIAEIKKQEELARAEREKEKIQALKIAEEEKIKKGKERIKKIIVGNKNIVKEKERLVIKTEPINFDYNLWYIRKDAKKAANRVIRLMKKHPDMIVEIGTHTDIRGNNNYNLNLSRKRANSVREYFIEQGIDPENIRAIGYGETQPIIKCATEESCSEEQHEINRRCEFVIKNW